MDLIWKSPDPDTSPPFDNATSPYIHYSRAVASEGSLIDPADAARLRRAAGMLAEEATRGGGDCAELDSQLAQLLAALWAVRADAAINQSIELYDEDAEKEPAHAYLEKAATPDGPSAIIGVIDDGIPFAHELFRLDGTLSRVASVWLQDAAPADTHRVGRDLPIGRELRGAEISRLLSDCQRGGVTDEDAVYRAAGAMNYARGPQQRLGLSGTHGAAVAAEAAGFGPAEAGVARNLPLIGVNLPAATVRDTLGMQSALWVGLGALFILHRARRLCHHIARIQGKKCEEVRLPVIINLSYGLTAGPKDGSSMIERVMEEMMSLQFRDVGPVRFILPMGNHRLSRLNATVTPGEEQMLGWEVQPDDRTPSFVEFWGPHRAGAAPPPVPMQIAVRPQGQPAPLVSRFAAHGTWQHVTLRGREICRAHLQYRPSENGGREVITLVTPPTRPEGPGAAFGLPGHWVLGVHAVDTQPVRIEVQRDETLPGFGSQRGRQSYLVDPDPVFGSDGRTVETDPPGKTRGVLRSGTMNSYAGAPSTVRVGGTYRTAAKTVPYSGLGFLGSNRPAEGDVLAPAAESPTQPGLPFRGTRSGTWRRFSGTSLAAPAAARALAEAFAGGADVPAPREHARWVELATPRPGKTPVRG